MSTRTDTLVQDLKDKVQELIRSLTFVQPSKDMKVIEPENTPSVVSSKIYVWERVNEPNNVEMFFALGDSDYMGHVKAPYKDYSLDLAPKKHPPRKKAEAVKKPVAEKHSFATAITLKKDLYDFYTLNFNDYGVKIDDILRKGMAEIIHHRELEQAASAELVRLQQIEKTEAAGRVRQRSSSARARKNS